MKTVKIIGLNILVFVVYTTIIINYPFKENAYGLATFVTGIFAVTIQCLACIILAVVMFRKKKKEEGQGYLITALLIILIGASFCGGFIG